MGAGPMKVFGHDKDEKVTIAYEIRAAPKAKSVIGRVLFATIATIYAAIFLYMATDLIQTLRSPLGQTTIEILKDADNRSLLLQAVWDSYKWWLILISVVFWVSFTFLIFRLRRIYRWWLDRTYNRNNRS